MMHENIKKYKESMDELHFSAIQKEKLFKRLSDANCEKNGGFMKSKFNIKKISAAVAACFVLVSGTAFAAGQVASIASSNRLFTKTSNFEKLEKLEDDANIDVTAIENFSNGYTFDYMEIEDMQTYDEEQNKLHDYSGISIQYKNDGLPEVFVDMSPVIDEAHHIDENSDEAAKAELSRVVGDIVLYYSQDEYLFLPASEEADGPTDEEKLREETDNHFYISYGSDERETQIFSNVSFEMDNVIYVICSFDNSLSGEEFLDMAEEIVSAK
ncbi:MAG: DUF4179 domain-containing protein [Pseudobutyrivibrio sp.]|nr:DUF4179 domain-containing protein [Pseudobutyrivibrio sp.]